MKHPYPQDNQTEGFNYIQEADDLERDIRRMLVAAVCVACLIWVAPTLLKWIERFWSLL